MYTSPSQPRPDTLAHEVSKKSSKGPIIDDEGFITPHPIKEKRTSKKEATQPHFREKIPPKSPSTSQPKPKNASGASKRGKRNHETCQDPRQIKTGSLQPTMKSPRPPPTSPSPPLLFLSPPSTTTTATPQKPNATTNAQHPASASASNPTTHDINNNSTITHPPPPTSPTSRRKKAQPLRPKTKSVLTSDSNNSHLSWADEVIQQQGKEGEEAAEAEVKQPTDASAHSQPQCNHPSTSQKARTSPPLPSPSSSSQTQLQQQQQQQQIERNKSRRIEKKKEKKNKKRASGANDDDDDDDDSGKARNNRFSILGRSVDCA